jgi:hypothetical protein
MSCEEKNDDQSDVPNEESYEYDDIMQCIDESKLLLFYSKPTITSHI